MKIVVDENIPRRTVVALRAMGHEVIDLRGTSQEGMTDAELWMLAQSQGALLITTDRGFARHRHEAHHGILIIRLRQPNRERIHQRILQALAQVPPDAWNGLLMVVKDRVQSVWRTPPNL